MSGDEGYSSPFSWRYGSEGMRALWSEAHKHRLWRRIWVALARTQAELGLVSHAQVDLLEASAERLDLARARQIEAEIHHDLMAEVRTWAEQVPEAGGILHLGATSMDIEDNADALRIAGSLDRVLAGLERVLGALVEQIERHADHATMAFTHLQPAEPTTVGYRLAQYAWDLIQDLEDLRRVRAQVQGKGFKGAVGTSASYLQLLGGDSAALARFEQALMARLGLEPAPVATQTSPRKQELRVLNALAGLGQSLYKLAADVRLLQSPPIGEWAEPFGRRQVGSSAMPFKRNPILSENIDSLARLLAALPRVAWDNAAHSYLERTLDDSANRRTVLPEAFLLTDELLSKALRVVSGLRVDTRASGRLLERYGPFAATERLMMELARRGGDRQELHERIREHSLAAWAAVQEGQDNPLVQTLCLDPLLRSLAPAEQLRGWLYAADYVGDAPARARALAARARGMLPQSARIPDSTLRAALPTALLRTRLEGQGRRVEGKVRDSYLQGQRRILVTTDRISAFDRVLGVIPYKGQVLNQLAAWWFAQTSDLVDNHLLELPDPNAAVVREAQALPVEVVVRGYITGVTSTSLWTLYNSGVVRPYGLDLPSGLRKNSRLPAPVLTPTTKAEHGGHDTPLASAEVVERGLVEPGLWAEVQRVALALYARGAELAARAGLVLADTKYEFGLVDGRLCLIDEVHTPDSSRYWRADSIAARLAAGEEPEGLDKELLRRWLAAEGYTGDGAPPPLSEPIVLELARRYISLYEQLTGRLFVPAPQPVLDRLEAALAPFALAEGGR